MKTPPTTLQKIKKRLSDYIDETYDIPDELSATLEHAQTLLELAVETEQDLIRKEIEVEQAAMWSEFKDDHED